MAVFSLLFFAEINSTYSPNLTDEDGGGGGGGGAGSARIDEDVLYQRGASFSAKLDDTNAHIMDNAVPAGVEDNYLPSNDLAASDDNFYSREDVSVYDDVDNNRLNLPAIGGPSSYSVRRQVQQEAEAFVATTITDIPTATLATTSPDSR